MERPHMERERPSTERDRPCRRSWYPEEMEGREVGRQQETAAGEEEGMTGSAQTHTHPVQGSRIFHSCFLVRRVHPQAMGTAGLQGWRVLGAGGGEEVEEER